MAATATTRALINDTDANFRLWGKAISDQFAAGGWSATADTGQVNWTTVTKPGATNTVAGYEIWSSNDSGGGLNNYYVKIEYGSAGTSANQPAIWLTVGWASDGAGTLTGIISTRKQLTTTGTATTTLYNCYLSAGTGWVAIAMGTASTFAFFFSIERTRNSSLAQQNEVSITANFGAGSAPYSQVVTSTTAYPVATLLFSTAVLAGFLSPPQSADSIQGGVVGLGLVFGVKGYFTNPLMNQFLVNSGQLGGPGTTVSVTNYGAAHTYMILTNTAVLGISVSTTFNTLLRYE